LGKSRFSNEQIAFAVALVESGMPVGKACRQLCVSEAGLYNWRKKFRERSAQSSSLSLRKPRMT
jgi:putative transposase